MEKQPRVAAPSNNSPLIRKSLTILASVSLLLATAVGPTEFVPAGLTLTKSVTANSNYANLSSGSLSFSLTPSTVNLITTNDNWSNVASVEGYFGNGLTAVHGIDPQTILGTEFANNALPSTPTNVSANKGNPSAFNAGGIAEFDTGTYLAIGMQGNVQANPYIVFYLNTLGRTAVSISYQLIDIDSGSNNSISPVALQYRVGSTGPFTNVPAGYVADVTQGPNIAGLVTSRTVTLPSECSNKPTVQVRLITTNAASTDGSSTPDEWIGVNNMAVSSSGALAAETEARGRVTTPAGVAVPNALVELIDANGERKSSRSNAFGYYRIPGLTAGGVYVVLISSKRYVFESHVITVNDTDEEFNFAASRP